MAAFIDCGVVFQKSVLVQPSFAPSRSTGFTLRAVNDEIKKKSKTVSVQFKGNDVITTEDISVPDGIDSFSLYDFFKVEDHRNLLLKSGGKDGNIVTNIEFSSALFEQFVSAAQRLGFEDSFDCDTVSFLNVSTIAKVRLS